MPFNIQVYLCGLGKMSARAREGMEGIAVQNIPLLLQKTAQTPVGRNGMEFMVYGSSFTRVDRTTSEMFHSGLGSPTIWSGVMLLRVFPVSNVTMQTHIYCQIPRFFSNSGSFIASVGNIVKCRWSPSVLKCSIICSWLVNMWYCIALPKHDCTSIMS